MVKDLLYLASRMEKYSKAVGADANQYTTDLSLAVLAAVAQDTPVDVGTAKSNWQLTVGAAAKGVRRAFSPFTSRWRRPYGQGGTKGETRNQAGVVWSGTNALKARKPDQPVYIVNNSPYIDPLNEGHSPQSQPGFVQRAVIRGRSTANSRFRFKNTERA